MPSDNKQALYKQWTTFAYNTPRIAYLNSSSESDPSTSCSPGWFWARDYDSNLTLCQECLNSFPDFAYCPGDGLQHLCSNKPLPDQQTAYIPQGLSWSNQSCPYYCLNPYQYQTSGANVCANAVIGSYPSFELLNKSDIFSVNGSTVGRCRLPFQEPGASYAATIAPHVSFVSSGYFNNSNSCGFAVRRKIVSIAAPPRDVMWCERLPNASAGLHIEVGVSLSATKLLQRHAAEKSLRIGVQIASVYASNTTNVTGGWSWYLVSSLDNLLAPNTLSLQLWFNASFLMLHNETKSPVPMPSPASVLFFSRNVSVAWAAVGNNAPTSLGVSIDFAASTLSFSVNRTLVGAVRSFPWTQALSVASRCGAASWLLSLGGWLAYYDVQPIVHVTEGQFDVLPLSLTFLPGRVTYLATAPYALHSLSGWMNGRRTWNQSMPSPPALNMSSSIIHGNISINRITLQSFPDVLSLAAALAIVYQALNNTVVDFSSIVVSGGQQATCRGGCYGLSSTLACVMCPPGSTFSLNSVGVTVDKCRCTNFRELRGPNQCELLFPPFGPAVVTYKNNMSTVVLAPSTDARASGVTLLEVQRPTVIVGGDGGLVINGTLKVWWNCTTGLTTLGVVASTAAGRFAVIAYVTAAFGGDLCSVCTVVNQTSRFGGEVTRHDFSIVPKANALSAANVNIGNWTVLDDNGVLTTTINISVANYSFFPLSTLAFLSVSGPNLTEENRTRIQNGVNSAAVSCVVFYASSISPPSVAGDTTRVVSAMYFGDAYTSSTGVLPVVLQWPSASLGVAKILLSIVSESGSAQRYFDQSDVLTLWAESRSFAAELVPPTPNEAANSLSSPAALVVSILGTIAFAGVLVWTLYRRPIDTRSSSSADDEEDEEGESDEEDDQSGSEWEGEEEEDEEEANSSMEDSRSVASFASSSLTDESDVVDSTHGSRRNPNSSSAVVNFSAGPPSSADHLNAGRQSDLLLGSVANENLCRSELDINSSASQRRRVLGDVIVPDSPVALITAGADVRSKVATTRHATAPQVTSGISEGGCSTREEKKMTGRWEAHVPSRARPWKEAAPLPPQ